MTNVDAYSPVRNYVKKNLLTRAHSNPELIPSRYWTDFARNFRYVYDLPKDELQRIRFHTYHLTSDLYLTYYFASDSYKDLLAEGYRFFHRDGYVPCIEEGEHGIGVITEFGRVSHDLLRYLGALCDVIDAGLVHNSNQVRIAEIGGGYGGLARAHLAYNPRTTYVICDLEETLFFSAVYLTNHLGTNKVHLLESEISSDELEEGHVYFVPQSKIALLDNLQFDYVVNQQSFQEMTQRQVERYLGWIATHAKYLYTCNAIDHGDIGIEKSLVMNLPDVIKKQFGTPQWIGLMPDSNQRFGDNHLVRAVYQTKT